MVMFLGYFKLLIYLIQLKLNDTLYIDVLLFTKSIIIQFCRAI